MNRLAEEKSPYLLQHAHNPVDWYPWGKEAFDKARDEDKPVFLSVGYSTCHWCHVMERESFESREIAEVLNREFVPVKVDREERPDVDRIYMTFVQATTGGGGWPMSVFMTPDLKPFFGGTYFPPDNRYGRPGFKSVLEHLASAWKNDRARILQSANEVIEQLRAPQRNPGPGGIPDKSICESGFHAFRRMYDSTHGGFGGAPKFPRPVTLAFLMRYAERTGTPEATDMVLHTLRAMAAGGMYDHLGGGFHRYSVDDVWFVPHFEKMLYDQAQLAIGYLEAFQITHDDFFAGVARDIFTYVLRDMTAPDGGFWSAEDADSPDPEHPHEKREGAFYLWTDHEIKALLGHPGTNLVATRFGIEKDGNVSNDPHGEFKGQNIIFLAQPVEDVAATAALPVEMVRTKLTEACAKLLEVRSKRPRPHLDDKILAAWNGLMISAFARGAQVLNEPRYAEAARRAAEFIMGRMWRSSERILLRRWRDDAAIPAFLDDYAFMAQGLLDLYETVFDLRWLDAAIALTERMLELFEDQQNGAFFTTAADDSSLPLRVKDDYDGAEPAGNSIAILNLIRLARITGRDDFRNSADRALRALVPRIAAQPAAVPAMLTAMMYSLSHPRQIILAGDRESASTRAFLEKLHNLFLPDSVVLLVDSDETRSRLRTFSPNVADMRSTDGRTVAYVCRDYACELPTDDVERFTELLK